MPHIHEHIDFTASVFIVNGNAVLLRKHEKYHHWLQVGGHIELKEDPVEAVLREAKEESGLDVILVGSAPPVSEGKSFRNILTPQFINRHTVAPGHEHVDFIYFGTSETRILNPHPTEQSVEMYWFTQQELEAIKKDIYESTYFYATTALAILGA